MIKFYNIIFFIIIIKKDSHDSIDHWIYLEKLNNDIDKLKIKISKLHCLTILYFMVGIEYFNILNWLIVTVGSEP